MFEKRLQLRVFNAQERIIANNAGSTTIEMHQIDMGARRKLA